MNKTPTSGSFKGNLLPMISPNGMSPSFRPSRKIIKPTITASNPSPSVAESRMLWSRTRSWKSAR